VYIHVSFPIICRKSVGLANSLKFAEGLINGYFLKKKYKLFRKYILGVLRMSIIPTLVGIIDRFYTKYIYSE
jgi:hypothetical protein